MASHIRWWIATAGVLVGQLVAAKAAAPTYSALWGRKGERWTADSRLPDFSYAGYRRGEKPLPTRKPQADVKSFGAVGDGKANDTAAFKRAIAEAKVIAVPPGRYVISDFLDIRASGTCLQGAGPDRSVLYFPTPLNEIKPNWGATTSGRRTSNYSWSGGFVRVLGSPSRKVLAEVTAPAERGGKSLTVSSPAAFRAGQDIRLELRDTKEQSLARYLYAGDPGSMRNLRGRTRASFQCRLTRVDKAARRIEFDRPLRTDVRAEWRPRLYAAAGSVEEVGVEGLRFEFPNTPYKGHFTERGFNAIAMYGCRNCWVRSVRITNADSGIFLGGTNITLRGILIDSQRRTERSRKATGHHGVTLGGQDNLLEQFEFRTRFMHDITVTRGSAGNVASRGRGLDVCFDHHCYGPHANLFTEIDLGEGSRMFQSGGGAALGRHCGAWETFWNIRARRPQTWPRGWGPDRMNLIGVRTTQASVTRREGRWLEAISPQAIQPQNLYRAQLDRRLGRKSGQGGARPGRERAGHLSGGWTPGAARWYTSRPAAPRRRKQRARSPAGPRGAGGQGGGSMQREVRPCTHSAGCSVALWQRPWRSPWRRRWRPGRRRPPSSRPRRLRRRSSPASSESSTARTSPAGTATLACGRSRTARSAARRRRRTSPTATRSASGGAGRSGTSS